ncbi:MAG TPA: SMP-30/gluconolactonase/LRE family protein [Acidobacteriaceae bacterium]|nr:SMP-30/gluconolactonase/LRE family protein [Acidobacteriaceae bacterium]
MGETPLIGEPVCIAPIADRCGEGAVWHPTEKALFWVDINRFLIHSWHAETHAITTWSFEEPVTALNLTTDDSLLIVCFASRITLWDWTTGMVVEDAASFAGYALPGAPRVRCNDARVDAAGRLWVATMQNNLGPDGEPLDVTEKLGELFSLDATGHVVSHRRKLGIGNTVAWSPNARFLYTADTLADAISTFEMNRDGTLDEERLWFQGGSEVKFGLPDGSAMDAEGFLWNCRHGGGCVLRISPEGVIDHLVTMPVKNPTTCVFGGVEGMTLFVTSAAIGDEENPLAGGLFAMETKTHGLPGNRFRLLR